MTLKDAPSKLQPYIFHGVLLDYKGRTEPLATCPFCGNHKFYVSASSGQFQCKSGSCAVEGNTYNFLQLVHEESMKQTEDSWWRRLGENRGVDERYLIAWGVAESCITGEVIVPGFNIKGRMTNLYQWLENEDGKRILYSTPTLRHGLFGAQTWRDDCKFAIIAEGPWTGAACCQILGSSRGELVLQNGSGEVVDVKVVPTRNQDRSLLQEWNVVGVPGCNSFRDVWSELFSNLDVMVLFDNDYPAEKSRSKTGAGWSGTLRTARLLLESDSPPASVRGLQWGTKGYDPTLPNRYDLRDVLSSANGSLGAGAKAMKQMQNRLVSLSSKDVGKTQSNGQVSVKKSGSDYEPVPVFCESYREVRNSWRKALKWTDNLDVALSSMFATAGSTGLGGMCPLWLRLIGAPGTAKSTLCEAFAVSRKYTYSMSVFTGLHSGARDSEGNTCSLIPDMNNRTVITKDGDTLLNASNRDQTLSQWRDLYEGTSRARYRNTKDAQEYTGLKITYILAGTKSLRKMNRSFLGDRFIDVVIYNKGDDQQLEHEILRRSAFNALRKLRSEQDTIDEQADKRMIEAKELTAGYLHYLRENMEDLLNEVAFSEDRLHECIQLGELISYMRARPDKESEEEDDETELATRLTEQMVRLAGTTAVVINKQEVDDEVMRRVKKVAMDTSRGITFKIAMMLNRYRGGLDARALNSYMGKSAQSINSVCRFMEEIGVLRRSKRHRANLWILTKDLRKLMRCIS